MGTRSDLLNFEEISLLNQILVIGMLWRHLAEKRVINYRRITNRNNIGTLSKTPIRRIPTDGEKKSLAMANKFSSYKDIERVANYFGDARNRHPRLRKFGVCIFWPKHYLPNGFPVSRIVSYRNSLFTILMEEVITSRKLLTGHLNLVPIVDGYD